MTPSATKTSGWLFNLDAAMFLANAIIGGFMVYNQDFGWAFFAGCMVLCTCTSQICRTIKETAR